MAWTPVLLFPCECGDADISWRSNSRGLPCSPAYWTSDTQYNYYASHARSPLTKLLSPISPIHIPAIALTQSLDIIWNWVSRRSDMADKTMRNRYIGYPSLCQFEPSTWQLGPAPQGGHAWPTSCCRDSRAAAVFYEPKDASFSYPSKTSLRIAYLVVDCIRFQSKFKDEKFLLSSFTWKSTSRSQSLLNFIRQFCIL